MISDEDKKKIAEFTKKSKTFQRSILELGQKQNLQTIEVYAAMKELCLFIEEKDPNIKAASKIAEDAYKKMFGKEDLDL